jgi:hypothetical protein
MWPFDDLYDKAETWFFYWKQYVENDEEALMLGQPAGGWRLGEELWQVYTYRYFKVIDFAINGVKGKIYDDIVPVINEHVESLNEQHRMLCKKDRYGIVDNSKWLEEREYFFTNVILPLFVTAQAEIKDFLRESIFEIKDDKLFPSNASAKIRKHKIIPIIDAYFGAWFNENIDAIFEVHVIEPCVAYLTGLIDNTITDPKLNDQKKTDDVLDSSKISPYDYEELCANILNENGWVAQATKKSGDQGADVYAEKNGISVVLQCKLTNLTVGNKAVQEIISGQKFMSADFAAVVTPAKYTPGAQDIARAAKVLLLHHEDLPHLESLCKRIVS